MNETSPVSSPSSRLTSPVAILIGAVLIAGSVLYSNGSGTALLGGNNQLPEGNEPDIVVQDPEKLVESDDPSIGDADAPVTIVEFSDFECPFCGAFFSDTYAQLKKDYIDTGKVRLVFRDYPLSFHPMAKPAAVAASCANEQGKFWAYHDTIFQNQSTLSDANLKVWAGQVGLDVAAFTACVGSGTREAEIDADIAAGTSFGVSGTPSFFINGKLVVGAQPFSAFKTAIDAEL
jgi:protein-disulfide isomerase